jgi:hypothetical protein
VSRALVIAGATSGDHLRLTTSEQIGVSPWYWWADVPVRHREALYVRAGRHLRGEPAVKYRGIFLNDEAPALSGWTREKFGGFNSKFYVHVFELLLRLRANFLWPAMWGNAFNDDDPLNPKLADEYGVVIGTSHHEPLMRAHDEWRRYGRGHGDDEPRRVILLPRACGAPARYPDPRDERHDEPCRGGQYRSPRAHRRRSRRC